MRSAVRFGSIVAVLSGTLAAPQRSATEPQTPEPATASFVLEWGSRGSSDGQFDAPRGIAVAPDGTVYVADVLNHRIQAFTEDGRFVRQIGTGGSGQGQLILPLDVTLDADGNVLVTDSGNFRIQEFSATGRALLTWGSGGTGDGQFVMPSSICVARSGHVFVSDGMTHTVQEFTGQGEFVARYGTHGVVDPGAMRGPRGLAADPDGGVWILDTSNLRVQKLALDGTFTWWPLPGYGTEPTAYPADLALGPGGSLYITDARTFDVTRYSREGEPLAEWGSFGTGPGQFTKPTGIAVDSRGNVYVAESHMHRVQKFTGR